MIKVQNSYLIQRITSSIIKSFFSQFRLLIGTPVYKSTTSSFLSSLSAESDREVAKVIVQIPYFIPKGVNQLSENKINALGMAVTKIFNSKTLPAPFVFFNDSLMVTGNGELGKSSVKEVGTTVEIRLIRLRYPYLDGSILAQYLALNAGKYNFTRMQKIIFSKIPTNSDLKSGPGPDIKAYIGTASPDIKGDNTQAVNSVTLLPSNNFNADLISGPGPDIKADFRTATPDILEHNKNTSKITGLKLELAGRLVTQRSIPRKTVENAHTGSLQSLSGITHKPATNSQSKIANKLLQTLQHQSSLCYLPSSEVIVTSGLPAKLVTTVTKFSVISSADNREIAGKGNGELGGSQSKD